MDAGRGREAETAAPVVRRAGPDDARAIAEVAVAGWQAAYRGILPDDFLDALRVDPRAAAWREILVRDVDGGTPTWVAESGDRIVGFVGSGPPRDDDVPLPAAEVYAIYVLPQCWRLGLGRALLDAAVAHWHAAGAETLALWVFEANAQARAFYEAMGWLPDGGRKEFRLGDVAAIEIRYRRSPGR
ncbi:MAG: GNAT family N-acetyltransferase [Candidatus Limnocylindrales bacterium]|jgi:GNAT superfamily N-acetyltransferase